LVIKNLKDVVQNCKVICFGGFSQCIQEDFHNAQMWETRNV
jgi:hypothetical protein